MDPVLRTAATRIERVVKIPIRLPSKLPDLATGPDRLYVVVETASATQYRVILGYTPDCNGASACRIGTLGGERDGQATQKLPGSPVHLNGGITGYFVQAECDPSCSDATLSWKEGEVKYSAGVKAGTLKQVTALANSMIP